MWYQILPSAAICGAALYAPQIFVYVVNRFFQDTPYMRVIYKHHEAQMLLRDYRLTGDVYVQRGLNCLDEEVEEAPPQYVEECIPTKRLINPPSDSGKSDL